MYIHIQVFKTKYFYNMFEKKHTDVSAASFTEKPSDYLTRLSRFLPLFVCQCSSISIADKKYLNVLMSKHAEDH